MEEKLVMMIGILVFLAGAWAIYTGHISTNSVMRIPVTIFCIAIAIAGICDFISSLNNRR
jgi:hypothetical protein